MGKRLSDLEEVYDSLTEAGFNFDSLPEGNKYRQYHKWKTDPTLREIPDASTRARQSDKLVGIRPFGFIFTDENQFLVGMSGVGYSDVAGNSDRYGDLTNLYGVQLGQNDAAPAGFKKRADFVPAKAVVAQKLGTPSDTQRSKITNKKYRKRTGRSITIPIGRASGADTEFDRQEAILTLKGATLSVTFKPERLRRA